VTNNRCTASILSEPIDTWPTNERETLVGTPPPASPAGPPPVGGPPPDRRIGAGMLLAIGAIVLVALGVLIAWLLTHRNSSNSSSNTVTTILVTTGPAAGTGKALVPRVVGLKEEQALVQIGKAGLRATEVRKPSKQPTGVVIGQSPQEATQLAKGKRMTIVVDAAPTTTTSPATTSATTTAATTAPTTTAQTTTSASPAPQPQSSTVPDVQGKTESAAAQSLAGAGILASLFFVPGTDVLGTVEQQAKPAGTTVPFHSHVQINVSRGPNNNPAQTVPNVVGKTLPDAVSTIQGAHLRLIYLRYPVTSRTQAGKIVQQSPLGGGQAPQNAQVLVYLGAYRAAR
jgi:beta-lactam-binding protein with PASTA domain